MKFQTMILLALQQIYCMVIFIFPNIELLRVISVGDAVPSMFILRPEIMSYKDHICAAALLMQKYYSMTMMILLDEAL